MSADLKPFSGTLYVTFGLQYARQVHPRFPQAHPDGYLTVVGAQDYETAREAVVKALGTAWSCDYFEVPEVQHAPRGSLATLDATTGQITGQSELCGSKAIVNVNGAYRTGICTLPKGHQPLLGDYAEHRLWVNNVSAGPH